MLTQFDYDLLADGKRSGVTETDDADNVTTIDWVYDDLGRLTEEVYDSWDNDLDFTADYVLDLVGNRLQKVTDRGSDSTDDETITSTFDANDRLLTEAKDDLTVANEDRFTVYGYGTGNAGTQQTGKTVHEGLDDTGDVVEETAYSYNLQGRMAQVLVDSDGDGNTDSTSQYEYADDGTRISETINGTKTLYVVDQQNPTGYSQVLEEKNSSSTVLKTFTLGLNIIAQQAPAIQSGGTLFLFKDGHGSTRGLVDALGLPLSGEIYRYDAFGTAIGFNPATALTSRLYNSEPFLGSIGLYDFCARLYDPRLARFLTLDPFAGLLTNPLTLHKLLFAHGDGINFNDPTGLAEYTILGVTITINSSFSIQSFTTFAGFRAFVQVALVDVAANIGQLMYLYEVFDFTLTLILLGIESIPDSYANPRHGSNDPIEAYEVGEYEDLSRRAQLNGQSELRIHHAPQKAIADDVIPGYEPSPSPHEPCMAIPKDEHSRITSAQLSKRLDAFGGPAKQEDLVARDYYHIRRYTAAPVLQMKNLAGMMKGRYPSLFSRFRR